MNSRTKNLILAGAAVAALGVGGTALAGSVGSDDNGGGLMSAEPEKRTYD